MKTALDIINNSENQEVLRSFFSGLAPGTYWHGMTYQLYFDKHDDSLSIQVDGEKREWLRRHDGSLVIIWEADRADKPICTENRSFTEFLEEIERKLTLVTQEISL